MRFMYHISSRFAIVLATWGVLYLLNEAITMNKQKNKCESYHEMGRTGHGFSISLVLANEIKTNRVTRKIRCASQGTNAATTKPARATAWPGKVQGQRWEGWVLLAAG